MNIAKKSTLATSLAALLVLGAAGGGVAYTKVTVASADRTTATKVWKSPKTTPSADDPLHDLAEGRKDHALSLELLPVPDGYRLGPDLDGLGNDVYLSGKKAEAEFRKGGEGLTSEARREHRKFVEKLDVQGVAKRSYALYTNDLVVDIELTQMNNKNAVKDLSAFQAELADALSIFREGPDIDGYKDAECYLMPKGEGAAAEVEEMTCTAYEDDVLVSVYATGTAPYQERTAPFREKKVAELLAEQLDRLTKGGGEAA